MFASTGGDVDVVPFPLLCHGRGQATGQPHGSCQVDLNVLFPFIWVPCKPRLRIRHLYICTLLRMDSYGSLLSLLPTPVKQQYLYFWSAV